MALAPSNNLLQSLQEESLDWFQDHVAELFDNVDDQLFQMADKAECSLDDSSYYDAMRLIRIERENAEIRCMQQFDLQFQDPSLLQKEILAINGNTGEVEEEALSAKEIEEENLAIDTMVSKAERKNNKSLKVLNERVEYLADNQISVNNRNNPVAPYALAKAFQSAISILNTGLKVHLIIYKLLDVHVFKDLPELYFKLNELLINANVLPELQNPYGNARVAATSMPVPSPSPTMQGGMQSAGGGTYTEYMEHDRGADAYAMLQQLMAQQQQIQQQLANAPVVSAQDVLSGLGNVSSTDIVPTGGSNVDFLRNLISETVQGTMQGMMEANGGKVNIADGDMIDVIGMLFDFIANDESLTDAVKALIARLQIPILKISIKDKNFFSNKKHPARQLLNDLSNAGLGVTEDVPARENPLFIKLESIINKVLDQDDENVDVGVYEQAIKDLDRFIQHIQEDSVGYRKTKKRSSRETILSLITTEIDSRLNNRQVPQVIITLLERVWKDVMLDIYFNEGMDSDEWDMALTFVETLIRSVEPLRNDKAQRQLVKIIPGILNTLNEGLKRIAFPVDAAEQLLGDLQQCHVACLKGEIIDDAELVVDDAVYISSTDTIFENLDDLDAFEEEELIDSMDDGSEQVIADGSHIPDMIEDEITEKARTLQPDVWLAFYDSDKQEYRAKISWISDDYSTFIFVTQTGQVAEKSLAGLTDALRSGQAKIFDTEPVFDRAMDSIFDELQRAS